MREDDRRELFEIYTRMIGDYYLLKDALRLALEDEPIKLARAKAYWLANIDIGISASDYIGPPETFSSFLENEGIIDDCGEFIEFKEFKEFKEINDDEKEG
jgi:hypothetical protein